MKKTKNENRDAQKKRTSHKAVESVLRPEGSLWWERFVKKDEIAVASTALAMRCKNVIGSTSAGLPRRHLIQSD